MPLYLIKSGRPLPNGEMSVHKETERYIVLAANKETAAKKAIYPELQQFMDDEGEILFVEDNIIVLGIDD